MGRDLTLYVSVSWYYLQFLHELCFVCRNTDSCTKSNGGCDDNALCSHASPSNAVVCTCKVGFTMSGTGSDAVCVGELKREKPCLKIFLIFSHVDSCTKSNGGCNDNALCSHASPSNAVVCTCKVGFTMKGTGSDAICVGELVLLTVSS